MDTTEGSNFYGGTPLFEAGKIFLFSSSNPDPDIKGKWLQNAFLG